MEIHVVQPGESLYRIAQHYGVPLAAVLRQNELRDPNRLTPGECILVPVGGRQYTVRRGDTLASIAEAQGTTVRQLWRDNPFLMGQDRGFARTDALSCGQRRISAKNRSGRRAAGHGRKNAAPCAAAAGLLSGRIVRL